MDSLFEAHIDSFKTLAQATEWLVGQGWKVSTTTLYLHCKKGLVERNKSTGRFDISELERYAKEHLKLVDDLNDKKRESESSTKENQKLKELRLRYDVEKRRLQAEKLQFENERAAGLWVRRSNFELELAARGLVLESIIRNEIYSSSSDLIATAGGDQACISEVIERLELMLNNALRKYADISKFQVDFES